MLIVAQKQLSVEEKTNIRLKAELSAAKNPSYVESQARNNLFMVKPGEHEVLLPGQQESFEAQPETIILLPNWQQWVNLFFPNTY